MVYADAFGSEGQNEHVVGFGSPGTILRLPDCGISVRSALGLQGLWRQGERSSALCHAGSFAGKGSLAEEESVSEDL